MIFAILLDATKFFWFINHGNNKTCTHCVEHSYNYVFIAVFVPYKQGVAIFTNKNLTLLNLWMKNQYYNKDFDYLFLEGFDCLTKSSKLLSTMNLL